MALATPSAPLGGPNRTVRVNSQRAKIKPASVKWPRPGHVTNAVTELNETLIWSKWQNGQELLILLTGSQMKIHWVYYGLDCYQCFTLLYAKDLGVFFCSPRIPHGSVIASSGGLIRHFGGLYSFVSTRHQGKFCLITLW